MIDKFYKNNIRLNVFSDYIDNSQKYTESFIIKLTDGTNYKYKIKDFPYYTFEFNVYENCNKVMICLNTDYDYWCSEWINIMMSNKIQFKNYEVAKNIFMYIIDKQQIELSYNNLDNTFNIHLFANEQDILSIEYDVVLEKLVADEDDNFKTLVRFASEFNCKLEEQLDKQFNSLFEINKKNQQRIIELEKSNKELNDKIKSIENKLAKLAPQ